MISSEDIAYLAGLFDGEGSIYFAKRIEKKISQLQDSPYRDKLLKKIEQISEINERALEAVSPDLRV